MLATKQLQVTVIIPTFNRSRYLGAAIDSILAQSVPAGEVILVDDGSTDDTRALAGSYGSRVRYLHKENGGKSSALNLGLKHATGDLIWIFDDDDIAAPRGLEFMLGGMEDPDVGFAHGSYVTFKSGEASGTTIDMTARDAKHGDVEHGRSYQDRYGLHIGLMMQNFVMQPGLLVRKHCYAAVGPFDEKLIRSQDYDMLLRLVRRFKAARVDEVVFYQRHHRGRRGSLKNPVKAGRVNQAWIEYDRIIFEAINENYDLMEFLPGACAQPPSSDDRITAHLIRGCIMGRRQLWDHAASDLGDATALAAKGGRTSLTPLERDTLRQLLDIRNPDPTNILDAEDFLLAISRTRSWRLREDIRAALLYPLPYVIRRALKDKPSSEASRVLRTYARIATPCSAVMAGLDKMKSKLQSRQMQQTPPVG